MPKQPATRILLIAACSIILYLLILFSSKPSAAAGKDDATLTNRETAGTHLLWESLSHQFVSAMP